MRNSFINVIESPTTTQGDVVLFHQDDCVRVFLVFDGSDLPLWQRGRNVSVIIKVANKDAETDSLTVKG